MKEKIIVGLIVMGSVIVFSFTILEIMGYEILNWFKNLFKRRIK